MVNASCRRCPAPQTPLVSVGPGGVTTMPFPGRLRRRRREKRGLLTVTIPIIIIILISIIYIIITLLILFSLVFCILG